MPPKLTTTHVCQNISNIHGANYIFPYIEKEYFTNLSKLTGICKIHGEFKVSFSAITQQHRGCPTCGNLRTGFKSRLDVSVVLSRLRLKHGDKYTFPYVETEFCGCESYITGVCKIHGEFKNSFNNIYRGQGCPRCGTINSSVNRRNVTTKNGLADYESYCYKLPITDGATKGQHGELQVKCKMCHQLMTPTLLQVQTRIRVISQVAKGECNFYCSDKCKSECLIYHQQSDTRIMSQQIGNYEAKVKHARNCQPKSKSALLKIQLKTYWNRFAP